MALSSLHSWWRRHLRNEEGGGYLFPIFGMILSLLHLLNWGGDRRVVCSMTPKNVHSHPPFFWAPSNLPWPFIPAKGQRLPREGKLNSKDVAQLSEYKCSKYLDAPGSWGAKISLVKLQPYHSQIAPRASIGMFFLSYIWSCISFLSSSTTWHHRRECGMEEGLAERGREREMVVH